MEENPGDTKSKRSFWRGLWPFGASDSEESPEETGERTKIGSEKNSEEMQQRTKRRTNRVLYGSLLAVLLGIGGWHYYSLNKEKNHWKNHNEANEKEASIYHNQKDSLDKKLIENEQVINEKDLRVSSLLDSLEMFKKLYKAEFKKNKEWQDKYTNLWNETNQLKNDLGGRDERDNVLWEQRYHELEKEYSGLKTEYSKLKGGYSELEKKITELNGVIVSYDKDTKKDNQKNSEGNGKNTRKSDNSLDLKYENWLQNWESIAPKFKTYSGTTVTFKDNDPKGMEAFAVYAKTGRKVPLKKVECSNKSCTFYLPQVKDNKGAMIYEGAIEFSAIDKDGNESKWKTLYISKKGVSSDEELIK